MIFRVSYAICFIKPVLIEIFPALDDYQPISMSREVNFLTIFRVSYVICFIKPVLIEIFPALSNFRQVSMNRSFKT